MNPPPPPPPNRGRANRVQGPSSALSSFLASKNISAHQIQHDHNARQAAARAAADTDAAPEESGDAENANDDDSSVPDPANRRKRETKAQEKKRKRDQEKAIEKIKAKKNFKRKMKHLDPEDEDAEAMGIYQKNVPLPAQLESCASCGKRFAVTYNTRSGPEGGLLCAVCARDLDKEEDKANKKKKTDLGRQRRKIQSDLLDGIYPGAKNLVTLCIETVAKNVGEADSLGDLAPNMIDRLAAILAKKRLVTSQTVDLFLQAGRDTVTIYDGAKLTVDDYIRIFQVVQSVKSIRLRNAVQFKNQVMDYLLGTSIFLKQLSLHGANLIDDERWNRFLEEKGPHLVSFKLFYTDGHFGDEQLELMSKTCQNLERLKISHNQKVTDEGLKYIARLHKLHYLGLEIYKETSTQPYVEIVTSIGQELRTLSLAIVNTIDDALLVAIHDNCKNLKKLRITDNEMLTDDGFAKLFTNWRNPPLRFVDFNKCRYLDPDVVDNPDEIGLASKGFEALMKHSMTEIRYLNVESCRHISRESFEAVFSKDKKYPELREIKISFCPEVNDFVVGSIFRSCPKLKTMSVFGNFKVKDVKVPRGKILIGMPNALGMQLEGSELEGLSAW